MRRARITSTRLATLALLPALAGACVAEEDLTEAELLAEEEFDEGVDEEFESAEDLDPESPDQPGGHDGVSNFEDPPSGGIGSSAVVTITGNVFYDDFRVAGRFELRDDEVGLPGAKVAFTGAGHNYLAALDATVEIYEIDTLDNPLLNCKDRTKLGETTVQEDGSFSIQVVGGDSCVFDLNDDPDIAVKVRTRYCDADRCFRVAHDRDNDPALPINEEGTGAALSLYFPNASSSNPEEATSSSLDVGSFNFENSAYDDFARGASMFASLVDVTRRFNVENGIEYVNDDEVVLEFPDNVGAASTNGTVIHIPSPAAGKWGGNAVMHEMGHAMHDLTWGTTGTCSTNTGGRFGRNGDGGWGVTEQEWPTTALSEAFGNFVSKATLDTCDADSFDVNEDPGNPGDGAALCNADTGQFPDASTVAVTYPNDGKSYVRNVSKMLCDWYDSSFDDDPLMAGGGDHFSASLSSTWRNFEEMFTLASSTDCLDICDYVDYYVNDRKSVAKVGQASHDAYVDLIADLAYQNGLKCGLPTP